MTGRVAIGLLVSLGSTFPLAPVPCLLEPGKPVQASSCSFESNAADYIRVIVEPNFVKLSAKLITPKGTVAADIVNLTEEDISLPLAAIATEAGVWVVEVTAPSAPAPQRPFSLRLEERRLARSEDVRRIAADRAFLAGLKQRMERNAAAYRAAASQFSSALAIRDELGDRAQRGPLLAQLGGMHHRLGDLSRALAFYEQARDAYREAGDAAGEAGAVASAGQADVGTGNLPQALELLSQALAVFRKLGMRRREAEILGDLASVNRLLGDPVKAVEYHEASLQLTREE